MSNCSKCADKRRNMRIWTSEKFLGCIIEQKTRYVGNIIAQAPRVNMQKCADWCATYPDGRLWTYNPWGGSQCYIFSFLLQRKTNKYAVSGNRDCASAGKRIHHVGPWAYVSKDTFFMVEEWNGNLYQNRNNRFKQVNRSGMMLKPSTLRVHSIFIILQGPVLSTLP